MKPDFTSNMHLVSYPTVHPLEGEKGSPVTSSLTRHGDPMDMKARCDEATCLQGPGQTKGSSELQRAMPDRVLCTFPAQIQDALSWVTQSKPLCRSWGGTDRSSTQLVCPLQRVEARERGSSP